jgi:uncharacterized NAD(P)/FAD-binding protein YdhS
VTQAAPSDRASPPTVGIVGGGASGTLTALQLLRQAARPLRVVLLERGSNEALGAAFSTRDPLHLLNVRAGAMSAFPDAPRDFVDWLAEQRELAEPPVEAGEFVARRRYAAYLRDRLRSAAAAARPGVTLEVWRDSVVRVAANPPRLALASGRSLPVDRVVLALGNFQPRSLPLRGPPGMVRDDPWAPSALAGVPSAGGVLLVGTGLTMVDAVVSLVASQGHTGPIYGVSRRGLLPRVHVAVGAPNESWAEVTFATTTRGLVRQVRARAEGAAAAQRDWRTVLDGLRPDTQKLWRGLPPTERERFLRHVVPYWDTHRHRIAPRVGQILADAQASGQLRVWAGRVLGGEPVADGGALRVQIGLRRDGVVEVEVERVLNCTGPATDYERVDEPLVANLLGSGQASADPQRLGFRTAAEGRLLAADGSPSATLFGLGPVRRAELWETTAIPEIRAQAARLAEVLTAELALR